MEITENTRPTRQDLARLATRIEDAVREVTGADTDGVDTPHPSASTALEVLRGLTWARTALAELEDHAARTAGAAGATYADLGAAAGISRQAARTRWPDAVDARPGRPRKREEPSR